MYATLMKFTETKQFNFHWVGFVITIEEISEFEKEQLKTEFKKKNMYPIFKSSQEIEPFLSYYERIIRPLFHMFKGIKNIGLN